MKNTVTAPAILLRNVLLLHVLDHQVPEAGVVVRLWPFVAPVTVSTVLRRMSEASHSPRPDAVTFTALFSKKAIMSVKMTFGA
jgi:hypothetical protein